MELCNPLTNVEDLRLTIRSQYALPKRYATKMNRKQVCNAFQKCSGKDLPLPPMRYQKVNPTTGVHYPRDTPLSGRDFYNLFSNPKLKELQRLARKLGVFQKDATKSMLFMSITEFLKALGVPEPVQVRLTPNKANTSNSPKSVLILNNNNNNLKISNNNNNNLKISNNNNNLKISNNNNNLRTPPQRRVGPPVGGPTFRPKTNAATAPPPPQRRIPLPPAATPRLRDYEELMRKSRYGNESSLKSWGVSRGLEVGNYKNKGELFNGLRRQQRDKLNVEDLRTLAKSLGMKNTSSYKTKNGLERAIYEFKKTSTSGGPPVSGPPVSGPPVSGPPVRVPPPPAPKGPSNNNKKGPPPPQIVEVTKAIKNKNISKLRNLENSTNSNVAKTAKEARVAVETKNNTKLRRVAEETNKTALRNLRMYANRKGVKNASKYETVETLERAIKDVESRPVSGSPNAALNYKLKETRAAANAARVAKNNKRAAELKEREMKLVAQIEKNKAAAANKLEKEKAKLATNLERKKAEANAARRAKNAELTAKLEKEKAELNARLERKKAEANAARSKPGLNFSLPNIQVPKFQRAPPEVREARREKVRSIFKSKVQKIFDEVYPGEDAGNKKEANKFVAAIKKKGKNASSVNAIYAEIYGNKAQLEAEGRNVNSIMAKRTEFKRKLLGAVATVAKEAGVPQAEVTRVISEEPAPGVTSGNVPVPALTKNRITRIFTAVYTNKQGDQNNAEEFKTKIRNLGNKVNANSIEEVYKAVYALGKNNVNNTIRNKRDKFTKMILDYKKSEANKRVALNKARANERAALNKKNENKMLANINQSAINLAERYKNKPGVSNRLKNVLETENKNKKSFIFQQFKKFLGKYNKPNKVVNTKRASDLYRNLVGLLKTDKKFLEKLRIKNINISNNGSVKINGQNLNRQNVLVRAKVSEIPKVQKIVAELETVEGVNKGAAAVTGMRNKLLQKSQNAKTRLSDSNRLGRRIEFATKLNKNTVKFAKKLNSKNTKELKKAINEIDKNIKGGIIGIIGDLNEKDRNFVIQEYSSDPEILAKIVEYTKGLSTTNAQKIFDKLPGNKHSNVKASVKIVKGKEFTNTYKSLYNKVRSSEGYSDFRKKYVEIESGEKNVTNADKNIANKAREKFTNINKYLETYKNAFEGEGTEKYSIYRNIKTHPVGKFVEQYIKVKAGNTIDLRIAIINANSAKKFYDNAKEIEKLLKTKTKSKNLSREPVPFFIASQNRDEQLVTKYYKGELKFDESKQLIDTLNSKFTKSEQEAAEEKQAFINKSARGLLLTRIRIATKNLNLTKPPAYDLTQTNRTFKGTDINSALSAYKKKYETLQKTANKEAAKKQKAENEKQKAENEKQKAETEKQQVAAKLESNKKTERNRQNINKENKESIMKAQTNQDLTKAKEAIEQKIKDRRSRLANRFDPKQMFQTNINRLKGRRLLTLQNEEDLKKEIQPAINRRKRFEDSMTNLEKYPQTNVPNLPHAYKNYKNDPLVIKRRANLQAIIDKRKKEEAMKKIKSETIEFNEPIEEITEKTFKPVTGTIKIKEVGNYMRTIRKSTLSKAKLKKKYQKKNSTLMK